jgi:hypothetical protein
MTKANQSEISLLNFQAIIQIEGAREIILLLGNEIYNYEETKHLSSALHIISETLEKTQQVLEELDDNIYPQQKETEK